MTSLGYPSGIPGDSSGSEDDDDEYYEDENSMSSGPENNAPPPRKRDFNPFSDMDNARRNGPQQGRSIRDLVESESEEESSEEESEYSDEDSEEERPRQAVARPPPPGVFRNDPNEPESDDETESSGSDESESSGETPPDQGYPQPPPPAFKDPPDELHWDSPPSPQHSATDDLHDDLAPSTQSIASEDYDSKLPAAKDPPRLLNASDTDDDDDEPMDGEMSISDLLAQSQALKGAASSATKPPPSDLQESGDIAGDMSLAELMEESMVARGNAKPPPSSIYRSPADGGARYTDIATEDDDDDDDRKLQANPEYHTDEESGSFFSPKSQQNGGPSRQYNSAQSLRSIAECADNTHQLNDDVYSMIFLASFTSMAFVFAMLTFILKMSIYSIIMADLLSYGTGTNPLNAPKGISTLVRCAQFFMLPVAVAIQEDLVASIGLFNVKFRMSADMMELPGATFSKWIFGSICRFLDGLYALVVNFLLLETADSVLGLMLNFAALGFLTEMDNVAFHLALEGYLSDGIQDIAKAATTLTLPKKTFSKSKAKSYLDSFFFVIVYLAILAGWIAVTLQQINGEYLCQSFAVNFGTAGWGASTINVYTDEYDKISHRIDDRAVYVGRDGAVRGVFAYCNKEARWTFIATEKDPSSLGTTDVCTDYLLASGDAGSIYDPTDTAAVEWVYYGGEFPVSVPSSFEMECL
uniref:Uncharacterized protein n=1 Tax=Helicotheca tamesis TaxID=374047 RepID=A0A7S2N5M8_9STRA|mmetsp:Transcript_9932/g.13900  ORF Transcript_9932/g.13900 Transcript_9932/m.13900 type:complete len:698 (+) Transcript_9932:139-2232(+)|eukprot:CAMPEP_0185730960 /NCGR_PEP_ID=MMETSP1171-20130828/11493_1 /TAXON_ID=374046 /ORGANISM="Helicotheca tamensis, Strain CCMP826" /LENGTH=697 /DNA_ID=CAMNT_0028400111 /DNA_START=60 /DNA_END=2153 /DNA_ORIENTATION=+